MASSKYAGILQSFLKSMGSGKEDIKNALMLEVARAIYEAGQTGYIGSKEDGNGTNFVTDVTKYLKPNS